MSQLKKKIVIFWMRRDLRLEDNMALNQALQSDYPVLPLFIFDKNILSKLQDPQDKRVQFIHQTLAEIKVELNQNQSDLLVEYETPLKAWKKILQDYRVQAIYSNEDYEPYALERDNEIKKFALSKDISFFQFKDQCIFSKDDIVKTDGKPYTVYTPYKNKWYKTLTPLDLELIKNKGHFSQFIKIKNLPFPSLKDIGFENCEMPPLVNSIKKSLIEKYHLTRDIPAVEGTSHLGIHLRFGTVSVRKCARIGYQLNRTWLDELIWREFFMQILYHYPHVVDQPFKEKYQSIPWRKDKKDFLRWCKGKTGYPIIDAGMRELNETGFMHNRVRMITASFLVKHLLIDWRMGEKYFAKKLLDFDLSANNGNWQWVAGTGCDAAPYFRIFNPHTQLKKFDPDLKYVKKWVPEFETSKYTEEMVEHSFAYHRALTTYKQALS
ncbi:MAG: deoxyribodipyrimidine photo-lyase [Halobacteriovoraceae bacterium]|nr:deoxyribodipyrimidine photo-lyase [Halobacteriovoraceae bacterium]MCB9095262.1 deoxyribodipyrimidine photo-lyase [Halobacteriovoraceae bacterium]